MEKFGPLVRQNVEANGYRFEWEYAAKANQDFQFAGSDNCETVAWCGDSSRRGSTRGVGQKKSNGFELFDMSGNVHEWCWDWYKNDAPTEGSRGPVTGGRRVARGGGWCRDVARSRISFRRGNHPSHRYEYLGFRLCRTVRRDSESEILGS